MAADELDNIQFTVADRFGWDYLLIEAMKISKLLKWYGGAVKLYEHESRLRGKQTDSIG